jgi:hypothetical protein
MRDVLGAGITALRTGCCIEIRFSLVLLSIVDANASRFDSKRSGRKEGGKAGNRLETITAYLLI